MSEIGHRSLRYSFPWPKATLSKLGLLGISLYRRMQLMEH